MTQPKSDVDVLKTEISDLRDQLKQISDTLQTIAGDRTDQAQRRVREGLHAAQARTRQATDEAVDAAARHIEERPFVSLAGALTIGLLIGTLISRKN